MPWSARARALRVEYETALAERYGDDPLHAQHRVTLDWPLAEPWFGGSNPQTWMPKWQQHAGPNATWRELQHAYQDIELDAIDTSARLWPDHTVISMATGFAFHDYTTTKPDKWDQPDAHPDRYRTWSIARDRHGDRFQARQNGAGDPNRTGNYAGAQGYGDWIEECFGPNGRIPGPIGCQMVKDIGATTAWTWHGSSAPSPWNPAAASTPRSTRTTSHKPTPPAPRPASPSEKPSPATATPGSNNHPGRPPKAGNLPGQ